MLTALFAVLDGVLLAASLYFLDCSQKYIFPWYYFRTLERTGKDMASLGGYGDTGYAQYMTAFNRNFGGSSGGGGGGGDGSGCGCLIAIAVVVVLILIVLGG